MPPYAGRRDDGITVCLFNPFRILACDVHVVIAGRHRYLEGAMTLGV